LGGAGLRQGRRLASFARMSAPQAILDLVERFERQLDAYKSGSYNEAQLRQEFLNPFFKALGWDMDNAQGYAAAYKDVIHEDTIRIGGAVKAPDYCFRIGGDRKFFLEAKKPAVDIKDEPTSAFQLRRYAWTEKLPLSLLSNFEWFAVYDGRYKPTKNDPVAMARVYYCSFRDYAGQWDWIAARFSRDAVLKGEFDKFAESIKGKRGTLEVDAAFLAEIEKWRSELARMLALRNASLTQRELNFAVQRIIDRIIFLRICEDRGIEDYGRLLALTNGDRIYPRLTKLFEAADTRYNSGLFHFKKESDRREDPDEFTLDLELDDQLLRDMLRGLYFPDSPYVFDRLSADILGQVYEQFLGKIIRLTEGHQAKVDEKPEVKKAGGVYYTPTYIVDYIVQQTVGERVAGKTPRQVEKLRILDPACGSGSFLIGAYQFLLDWHLHWYLANDPTKWAKGGQPALYQAGGGWKLTSAERKRILLNNIYGVDLDSQAVEVTKLSLLLKVLEGETGQSLQTVFSMFHQRALPDLGDNIKCGNSLIGPEFYQQGELPLLTDDEKYRINVFDWHTEFADVFKTGGFDVVLGNPPYIRIQTMQDTQPQEVEYFSRAYQAASRGNYDIYVVFVERGLGLLNKSGRLGFILPHKFFNAQYGAALRGLIAAGRHLAHVVHFGAQQVFVGATTYTCLMFLDKAGADACQVVKVDDLKGWQKESKSTVEGVAAAVTPGLVREAAAVYRVKRQKITKAGSEGQVLAKTITAAEWNFAVGAGAQLVERLNAFPTKLGDMADIFVGLQTSADDVLILNLVAEGARTLRLHSKELDADFTLENGLFHPLVSGTDVQGYAALPSRQYILFPYEVSAENVRLIPFDEIERRFPKTADYLLQNKKRLEGREKGKFRGADWYRFGRSQNLGIQSKIKICVPRLVDQLRAGFDADGSHFLDNVDVGGVTLKPEYSSHDLRYMLGLLNSKLLAWFFPNVSAPFRGGWMSANRQFLSQLPIRVIDLTKTADQALGGRMVKLVEQMLALHRQLAAARTPQEKTAFTRQITATAAQIDRLVYDLYGLTDDEIKIVKGASTAEER
jgi:hypothetical protein